LCSAQEELEAELLELSGDEGCGVCGGGDSTTESEPGGLKMVRLWSLSVTGTIEEMTVEVGTATEIVDWLAGSSLTQDLGLPALGGRVRARVGVGIGATESSVLPVAMYPTKAHINPKLRELLVNQSTKNTTKAYKSCMTRGSDR
jgi:hypothetical protein